MLDEVSQLTRKKPITRHKTAMLPRITKTDPVLGIKYAPLGRVHVASPPFKKDHPSFKPAGIVSSKLSRILLEKGAVSPSPAWLKIFDPIVTQNPMTVRRFFIIVIEKYLDKE
ncbi:hypothetical protein AVEN_90294-1 [Araneus ventricosus]|uniref:Uncharacterized protein n=1 Tax=Araneus ventricosus TaxID=182803 RepID=A0A4Y2UMD7_ARAVE|nr:hypothetical protein AVEN_90294-1 [Araneus ventricosus]